ncbi:MAG TPA: HNH endonuclease, partial [Myxococcales bacterium]|nr:HNH endonuclease [Myxococcales bacterium]
MLSTSVLVLNRLYQPVHVTSVRRAIILLYRGAAKAVDEQYQTFDFESWADLAVAIHHESIGTSSRRLRVPRVILLQAYDHLPRAKVRFSRLNIYARDDNTCQYCARQLPRAQLNLDHVVPRARGGRTTWENVVCCCIPCNLKKGAKLAHE